MRRALCMAALLAMPAFAYAGTCEDSFKELGDPRNGLLLLASVNKPGVGVSSALGQLQSLGSDAGFEIGAESISKGTLFLTQTNVRPPLVVHATAEASGNVSLGLRLAPGHKLSTAQIRDQFCKMLEGIMSGKQGVEIARAARERSGSGQVIDVKAEDLSQEMTREIDRAKRSTVSGKAILKDLLLGTSTKASADEMNAATAPVVAKYMGRKYRIDGQAYTVSTSPYSGKMTVAYLVTRTGKGPFATRENSDYNNLRFTIACVMAPDQEIFFSTLSSGSWVTLVGTVDQLEMGGMELRDCRQSAR